MVYSNCLFKGRFWKTVVLIPSFNRIEIEVMKVD